MTLTVNGTITVADGKTLTVTGSGTLNVKGANGAAGANGANGINGTDGTGEDGTDGENGADGSSGSPAISGGGSTFVRNGSTGDYCYYTRALGTVQGTRVYTVSAGEDVTLGAETSYASGVVSHGGVLYAKECASVSLGYTGTPATGYSHTGYTASAGTLAGSTLTMPANDVTIRATIVPNTYTVSFDANGGEGTMAPQGFTYDEAAKALTANAYTRVGSGFAGWAKTPGGGAVYADGVVTLYAVWTPPTYLDETGTEQSCADYTVLTGDSTAWTGGWYIAASDTAIDSRVTVRGDVHLILCDGATLTVTSGVQVAGENSLAIYTQSDGEDMGALTVSGVANYNAGIGGNDGETCGTVTTNGGTVTTNGGTVNANGSDGGAGVGGGVYGAGGTVTINGGSVTATGGNGGAGVGGGVYGVGGTVTINGGTVNANGDYDGADVGGGLDGAGGEITINGGSVTATGGNGGAGVGGGYEGEGGTITLGWTNAADRIQANSYSGAVTVAEGNWK